MKKLVTYDKETKTLNVNSPLGSVCAGLTTAALITWPILFFKLRKAQKNNFKLD